MLHYPFLAWKAFRASYRVATGHSGSRKAAPGQSQPMLLPHVELLLIKLRLAEPVAKPHQRQISESSTQIDKKH